MADGARGGADRLNACPRVVAPARAWYLDARFSDVIADGGLRMPFVNITIYEGHGKDRKDEIARRVTDTITDVCKLPREAAPDWYVAGKPGSK